MVVPAAAQVELDPGGRVEVGHLDARRRVDPPVLRLVLAAEVELRPRVGAGPIIEAGVVAVVGERRRRPDHDSAGRRYLAGPTLDQGAVASGQLLPGELPRRTREGGVEEVECAMNVVH